MCEPMKPAPPVTRYLAVGISYLLSFAPHTFEFCMLPWPMTYAQPAKTGTMGSQRIMWTCKTSSGPAAST